MKKPTAIMMDDSVHLDLKVISAQEKLTLNDTLRLLIESFRKAKEEN